MNSLKVFLLLISLISFNDVQEKLGNIDCILNSNKYSNEKVFLFKEKNNYIITNVNGFKSIFYDFELKNIDSIDMKTKKKAIVYYNESGALFEEIIFNKKNEIAEVLQSYKIRKLELLFNDEIQIKHSIME